DFIMGFIHGFEQGFGIASPSTVMMSIGGDIIQGLWNGFTNYIGTVFGGIGNFVTGIIGFFGGAGGWLVSAGGSIVQGLWSGISSGWSWLTGQVSSLAGSLLSAAKSALGIGSPSKLFADEVGAWIAPGLAQGIDATAHQAVTAAQRLAGQVTSAASSTVTTNLGVSGSAPSSPVLTVPTSTTGGQGVVVQLTVQGSVWTTQDLARELQTELLKYGIRNTSNGINYAFS
ncbi:MAG: phage tail protein, partial [Pseudonocardiaceae bacterium]